MVCYYRFHRGRVITQLSSHSQTPELFSHPVSSLFSPVANPWETIYTDNLVMCDDYLLSGGAIITAGHTNKRTCFTAGATHAHRPRLVASLSAEALCLDTLSMSFSFTQVFLTQSWNKSSVNVFSLAAVSNNSNV